MDSNTSSIPRSDGVTLSELSLTREEYANFLPSLFDIVHVKEAVIEGG